jgi:hypothetical protein
MSLTNRVYKLISLVSVEMATREALPIDRMGATVCAPATNKSITATSSTANSGNFECKDVPRRKNPSRREDAEDIRDASVIPREATGVCQDTAARMRPD